MADEMQFRIGVDGEKDLKAALADINRSFKVLGSEVALASSAFGRNEKSVESLTAKNTGLGRTSV